MQEEETDLEGEDEEARRGSTSPKGKRKEKNHQSEDGRVKIQQGKHKQRSGSTLSPVGK